MNNMKLIDIIIISLLSIYIAYIIGVYIYKKIKHKPTGECCNCKYYSGAKSLKEYYYNSKKECNCK